MHLQETNMIAKHGIQKDHTCEGKNMASKCKIFDAVTLTIHGLVLYIYRCICVA